MPFVADPEAEKQTGRFVPDEAAAPTTVTEGVPLQQRIIENAALGAADTVKALVPHSLGEVPSFLNQMFNPLESTASGATTLSNILFGVKEGKTFDESARAEFPEGYTLSESDKTPPFSRERFGAGFGTLAQVGMLAGGIKGITPKPRLSDALFGKPKPDPVAEPTLTETPLTDAAIGVTEKPVLPDWAREEMQRRGLDPSRTFNDIDIKNPSVVEAIQSDPTLTDAQKQSLLTTGSIKGGIPNVTNQIQQQESLQAQPKNGTQVGQEAQAGSSNRVLSPEESARTQAEPLLASSEQAPATEAQVAPELANQANFQVPPIVQGMAEAAQQSASQMRGEISNVRYGEPGQIKFEFRGETHIAPEPNDVMPAVDATGTNAEASRSWALKEILSGRAKPTGEAVNPPAPETAPAQGAAGFTTSKGSTYQVMEDGTTIRNKAARPEHPGDSGIKDRSASTFYVTPESQRLLGEVETKGGPRKQLALVGENQLGVQYLDGPNAGKFERRTVVPIKQGPAVGLHPVELFKDNSYHFGNEITELSKAASNPPLETPATGQQEPGMGAHGSPVEPAASVAEPPHGPTGIKNSIIDQDRVRMGLPERMKPARATNQEAWDSAMAKIDKNSKAGSELVADLVAKPRALDPTDTAVLLHEKLTRENNFDNSVEAVNNAKTETERTIARTVLQAARDSFHEIADVSQNQAGRESGLSLQARKMLVNRDFSLARMEAEERANANGGKPLSESQLADVKAAHEKIAELEAKIREHESEAQNAELSRYFDKLLKEAKTTRSKGGRVVDFLHEQRDKAREREKARSARFASGVDPAQLADQIIIGASHIADGLVEIGAWTKRMLDDYGDPIKPFLNDVFEKAKALHDATSKALQPRDKKIPATKEEANLKRVKTGYINRARELQENIADDQFDRPVRSKTQLDYEGDKLKGEYERLKDHWLTRQAKNDAANRTRSQKFWDGFVGIERGMKLSSDVVLAKLTLAAAAREGVLTPVEEAVGGVVSKVLPGLAKRAPREGGFSLDSEIKAKTDMLTKGMRDSWQNLKMQKSDLESLYGKKEYTPQEWYQYFGFLHGALKAPVKRAEFSRSVTKRLKWAAEEGKNIDDPNVIGELSQEAYVDANRAIFMQDNVVSDMLSGAFRMAERSKRAPNLGPAAARTGRFLLPIVKVPTNIVGEVATGVHGTATGAVRAGNAYLKGIESLPMEQGDAIMRQLKKGLVGNALLLTGYYGYKNIGGFYHQGDQREKGDVAPGKFRVGNVDLPAYTQHSTGAMLLNIGATVHRVQDERIKKSESETKGLGSGALVAGQGLAHELPFVPAITGISDAIGSQHGFEKYINGMIQSTIVPAIVSHAAKVVDTPGSFPSNILDEPTKRTPTNLLEAVKMGIPVLRGTVPEKSDKKNSERLR